MLASDLVDLAALVATEGPRVIHAREALSAAGAQPYWTASKCRLDRWSHRLRSSREQLEYCDERLDNRPAARVAIWRVAMPICREVLAAEILTRVWTAWSVAFDRSRGAGEAEPIARSILLGHLEARCRALQLIATGQGLSATEAGELDQFRRAAQRWTDFLLAPFRSLAPIGDLAHNTARLEEFAADWRDECDSATARAARALWTGSLRKTFASRGQYPTFNADLNARLASDVMATLGLNTSDGAMARYPSLWLARLAAVTGEAEAMIESLLAAEK